MNDEYRNYDIVYKSDSYPKTIEAWEVAGNGTYAPGLYRIQGGRTFYDEVWINNGGEAVYMARVDTTDGIQEVKRWIPHNTKIEIMFDPETYKPN